MPIHPSLKDAVSARLGKNLPAHPASAAPAAAVSGAAPRTAGPIPRPAAGSSSPPPTSTTTRPITPKGNLAALCQKLSQRLRRTANVMPTANIAPSPKPDSCPCCEPDDGLRCVLLPASPAPVVCARHCWRKRWARLPVALIFPGTRQSAGTGEMPESGGFDHFQPIRTNFPAQEARRAPENALGLGYLAFRSIRPALLTVARLKAYHARILSELVDHLRRRMSVLGHLSPFHGPILT